MADREPLDEALNAHREMGKNLALMITAYSKTEKALRACSPLSDGPITDSWLQTGDNPKRALFTIKGLIPTTNLDLKQYLPKDRVVYASLRAWWDGQIANAIQIRGDCPTFARAYVVISVGSRADLDNIGVKTLIDALVHNGVLTSDRPELLRCFSMNYSNTDTYEITVCVYEPDEEMEATIHTIFRPIDAPLSERPVIAKTGDAGSFFGPQKPQN